MRENGGPFPANTRRSITPVRAHIGSRILPLNDRSWIMRTIHQEALAHSHAQRPVNRAGLKLCAHVGRNIPPRLQLVSRPPHPHSLPTRYFHYFSVNYRFRLLNASRWIIASNMLQRIKKSSPPPFPRDCIIGFPPDCAGQIPPHCTALTAKTFNANCEIQLWKSREIFVNQ